jgi:hypothetical protein
MVRISGNGGYGFTAGLVVSFMIMFPLQLALVSWGGPGMMRGPVISIFLIMALVCLPLLFMSYRQLSRKTITIEDGHLMFHVNGRLRKRVALRDVKEVYTFPSTRTKHLFVLKEDGILLHLTSSALRRGVLYRVLYELDSCSREYDFKIRDADNWLREMA